MRRLSKLYIWERANWPTYKWDTGRLAKLLTSVHHAQGRLLGRMESLGFQLRTEAHLQTLTQDVLKSSEIEGENLDQEQVRSSIARRLNINVGGLVPSDRNVDGVVEMMLDATDRYKEPITPDRMFGWHSCLFPTGRSGMTRIKVGEYRDDADGPMQVVSGPIGREKVHYQAPPADRVPKEIDTFLSWLNNHEEEDPILRAGIAHLWFVTIHPFDDGNGRIGRAIADYCLSYADQSAQRFYSMSKQIRIERNAYYDVLEKTQKADLDITRWLDWFLSCLHRAILGADETLDAILNKARFWDRIQGAPLNERQSKIINKLLDDFEGKLTTSKWAKLTKCSQDTAYRDILDLVEKGILEKSTEGGRSTNYHLVRIEE
ncbi:MAG: Fic family protein [Parvibaculaceae bacterium]